jgi:hypothetical protein
MYAHSITCSSRVGLGTASLTAARASLCAYLAALPGPAGAFSCAATVAMALRGKRLLLLLLTNFGKWQGR